MDERADRGEFYPGGREGGVPPGTDTDKVDRVNLGELGESYTLKEVKAKVNQIVRAIAPAAVCIALCACAATAPLEDLPNTALVVTNEEDAVAMAAVGDLRLQIEDLRLMTNDLRSATNALTQDFRLKIEDLRLGTNTLRVALSATSNNLQSSILNLQSQFPNYALKSELPQDYLVESDITNFATRAWIAAQGYGTSADMSARIDAQDNAIAAATNAQNAAIAATSNALATVHAADVAALRGATSTASNALASAVSTLELKQSAAVAAVSNRLETATDALATAHAADMASLRAATNDIVESVAELRSDMNDRIDALELTGGMTRLWSSDATTYQDATGVVWRISEIYGWRGTALDLTNTTERTVLFTPVPGTNEVWSAGVGTNLVYDATGMSSYCIAIADAYYYAPDNPPQGATNLTITTDFDKYDLDYVVVALSTNPVDRVLYEQSPVLRDIIAEQATGTVARALTYGTPTRWTDATGCVWEVESTRICTNTNDEWTYTMDGQTYTREQMIDAADGDESSSMILYWQDMSFMGKDEEECEFEGWYVFDGSGTAPVGYDYSTGIIPSYASDPYLAQVTYYGTITATRGELVTVTNLVGRVAYTNDLPDTTAITNDIADLRTESALVYRLYSGSNVVVEVTNYNSQVHSQELRLMQLNESNEYITVWTEANGLARTLAKANEYTDAAITNRAAPRAWSKVTAGLGLGAPSNTTWLSTGRTVIAGGLEYEKHMTSGGAIWLLESNGMTADFHAQTNNTAFIDLSNADGTPIFRVEKTDSFLVGVHVDSVTVDGNALVCGVGVVAADHPLVRVKASLESDEWAKEEDGIPASLATVTWSGTTGNWTCRIQNNTGGNTLFALMEYFQEGGTKIVNSAALDVSEGILCTDGIHKCRPVYSSAGGGTITWEVVP